MGQEREEALEGLRNTVIVMDGIILVVLLAIYREDFPLIALFITQFPAFFLALAWRAILRRPSN